MIPVVIGTRGSALALAQTRLLMAELKRAWPQRNFEIRTIRTQGDRLSENPSGAVADVEAAGKGLFTLELETALRGGEIHLAVHSLKDLPTEEPEGLVLAAIPKRADARDALITRGEKSLQDLPRGARLATGSPRRAAQLLLARRDLRIDDIRGNIDTRLRKFRENPAWSGLILAAAGLERLRPGLADLAVTPLSFDLMLPAPGQGALAVQTRADAAEIRQLVGKIHDPATAAEVQAERMLLHALGGGCREPIAARGTTQPEGLLRLDAVAWLHGAAAPRRAHLVGKIDQAGRLGVELAVELSR